MKFAPQSEQEVQKASAKFGPWPNGIYDFEVTESEDKVSQKGNEMIVLTLAVYNADGDKRTVFDYLLESIPGKLRHACGGCGLMTEYEAGTLSGNDFYGKAGKLKLGVQPEKDGYPAKNVVRDYIVDLSRQQKPAPKKPTAAELDDEIPF